MSPINNDKVMSKTTTLHHVQEDAKELDSPLPYSKKLVDEKEKVASQQYSSAAESSGESASGDNSPQEP